MNIGMLWFDNDKHSALASRVARAAEYYRKKYGHTPDLCLVHPTMLLEHQPDGLDPRSGKVTLRSNRLVLPGHFWIGVEEGN